MTDTLSHRIVNTDPEIIDRYKSSNRAIDMRWLLIEEDMIDDRDEVTRKVWATLTVEMDDGQWPSRTGVKSFIATLSQDEHFVGKNFVRQKIAIANGPPRVQILDPEPVARFNRKRLEEYADRALAALRVRSDEDTIRYLFGEMCP